MRDKNSSSSSSDEDEMKSAVAPAWVEGLISESSNFFGACGVHLSRRKNDMNIFCLQCCLPICPHCLPSHSSHPLLQIRRYVYHHVVRLSDLDNLLDSSYIQPYTINGAKVIFLNHRPQSRPSKPPSNACFTCHRILQHPFHFCSLSCKVAHIVFQGADLSTILFTFDHSNFAFSQFQGLPMDASELTDDEPRINPYSMSSEATSNSQPPQLIVKKKKTNAFLPGIVLSLGSRRKGAPQRAPMS